MGYPGDQGKPDVPVPPRDEGPFAPRDEGPGAMPYGNEPFGGPADQTATWTDQPADPAAWGGRPGTDSTRVQDGRVPGEDAPYNSPAPYGSSPESFGSPEPFGSSGPYGPPPSSGSSEPHGAPESFGPSEPYGSPEGLGSPGGVPPGPLPGPDAGGPRPEKRRNMPMIVGAAAVAGLVLVGGGIGLSSMLKDDSEPAAPQSKTATTPPATPTPTQPVLAPVKLQSRTTDPKPLTLKEVFGNGKFKAGKYRYVRTAANAKRGCTDVAGGVTLDKALQKGRCTQALRATYALTTGSLIGTVGVFNLQSETAAKKAVKAAAGKDASLLALPGKGVSKTNGKGEALGTSQARGHYLIMTWVQRPDGKQIASKYHAAVRAFGAQMVKGSNLAVALHYRETEGKPLQR